MDVRGVGERGAWRDGMNGQHFRQVEEREKILKGGGRGARSDVGG